MMRIGFAKDIHALKKGKKLILGGINIPSDKGEVAHSDGDVVIHALSEALLGALALGDLGKFYPTNDKKYKDIESKYILLDVMKKVNKLKYKINNIDISIELEKPKLANYILEIRKNISKLLKIKLDQVSIKAGTNEKMDATGKGVAIIAYAIVLLEKK